MKLNPELEVLLTFWQPRSSTLLKTEDWLDEIKTEEGILVKNSGGLSEDWTFRRYKVEDIWAFQSIKKPVVPSQGNPIDFFVNEKLKQKKK